MIQEVVALIDCSGSMYGKESDTIGGINSTIEELINYKIEDETINFSLKFFSDNEYLKIKSINIMDIQKLKSDDLKPLGSTALLDAMGNTLSYFISKKKNNINAFDTCIIYVATDGLENNSKEFNHDDIKNLINEAQKYSIEVLYLGSNQDAILEGKKIGLNISNSLDYSETEHNVLSAHRSVARVAKRMRSGEKVEFNYLERTMSAK